MARTEQVVAALERSAEWEELPYNLGRDWIWREKRTTPEWAKERHWTQETYPAHVSITIIGRQVAVRRCSSPWMAARDFYATNKRALAIVVDPMEESSETP